MIETDAPGPFGLKPYNEALTTPRGKDTEALRVSIHMNGCREPGRCHLHAYSASGTLLL
jgi:hypothetical protein